MSEEQLDLNRVDIVQEILEEFLDREVITDDADYRGYDTTSVAKRILHALDTSDGGGHE